MAPSLRVLLSIIALMVGVWCGYVVFLKHGFHEFICKAIPPRIVFRENMSDLKTGDLLFFSNQGYSDQHLKVIQLSEWTHVAMVFADRSGMFGKEGELYLIHMFPTTEPLYRYTFGHSTCALIPLKRLHNWFLEPCYKNRLYIGVRRIRHPLNHTAIETCILRNLPTYDYKPIWQSFLTLFAWLFGISLNTGKLLWCTDLVLGLLACGGYPVKTIYGLLIKDLVTQENLPWHAPIGHVENSVLLEILDSESINTRE